MKFKAKNIFLETHAFINLKQLVVMMTFSLIWTQEKPAIDVENYVKSPINQLRFF